MSLPLKIDILKLVEPYQLEKLSIPARTILLREGEIAQHVYFIQSGCLRMWVNHNGNEITTQFFFEGKAIASMESLLSGQPSDFTLESIEPSTVYVMHKEQFLQLIKEDQNFKDWFNSLLLDRFFYYSKHLLSYLKNKPQERYNELLKKHPEILLRIPQHYIASYLGITSVSLSRIRNRKS